MGERRAQLAELAEPLGVALGATGTHPWSPWQEQRIIDTPHYRRNDELLRYVVWRNNSFGLHVHVGDPRRRSRGRRVQRPAQLPARAARAVRRARPSSRTSTRACTRRARRSSRGCSRAAACPDAYAGWDGFEDYVRFLYDTGSIDEHTQIWWSVRPHLAFPTVEIRICDAPAGLGEARALAALCYSLAARIARALDEGEPLP